MENLFDSDSSARYPLGIAVGEELLQHMAVRLQAISPGIAIKYFLLGAEILIGPSFDETRDRPAPTLRPTFGVNVKVKQLRRQVWMAEINCFCSASTCMIGRILLLRK